MESSSSSSSGLQENPSSVQLLNHHYQHLPNDLKEGLSVQENGAVCLDLGGKAGKDYCFVHWNWPVIRTACFWTALSITVACFCIVVGMIATVPKKCAPARGWHQGSVFYEIFPASFQDSTHDGVGDIRGVASRTEYLKSLGVSAIRLNSIFSAADYPEAYQSIQNLTSIDERVGTIDDLKYLLTTLHSNNISVVLDLPIYPVVRSLKEVKIATVKNEATGRKDVADEITNVVHNHRSHRDVTTENEYSGSHLRTLVSEDQAFTDRKSMLAPYIDGGISGLMKVTSQHMKAISKTIVEEALDFWFSLGVDGIYIKGLEEYLADPHLAAEIANWNKVKRLYSSDKPRILMADYEVLRRAPSESVDGVLNTFDLLDVFLEMSNGTEFMAAEISNILDSKVFTEKGVSWIHWNIGNVNIARLQGRVPSYLGAITFQSMLPGTISIFYGDEVGLSDSHTRSDHEDLLHMHQLAPMAWVNDVTPFTPESIVPWIPAGYAEHVHIVPFIRTITGLRQTTPSIYMDKICKEGKVILNTGIGFLDESLITVVRSYPRRFTYAVFYNADVKAVVRDLTHIYYGGVQILESSATLSEEKYIKFKNFTLPAGMAIIIKLDK